MLYDMNIRLASVPVRAGLPRFRKARTSPPLPVGGRHNFLVNPLGCGWTELIGNPRDARPRMLDRAGEALYGGRLWNWPDDFPSGDRDRPIHVQLLRGVEMRNRERLLATLRQQRKRSGGRVFRIDINRGLHGNPNCQGEERLFVLADFPFRLNEQHGQARRGRPPKTAQQEPWDALPGRFILKDRQAVEAFLRQHILREPDLSRLSASPRAVGLGWTEPKRKKPASEQTSIGLGVLSSKTAAKVMERCQPLFEGAALRVEQIANPDLGLFDSPAELPLPVAIRPIVLAVVDGMRNAVHQIKLEQRRGAA